jgi:serine protease Do
VLAIGNPFGVGQTVTSGIVSALARTNVGVSDVQSFIQTDAAINPGNSGGALITSDGRLIGINTAIFSQSGGSIGIGFAIPANLARNVVSSILSEGRVVRPWLGVGSQTVDKDLTKALSLKKPGGIVIKRVSPASPAARAGLKVGDVLLTLNDKEVVDQEEFRYLLAVIPIGETASVVLNRSGEEKRLSIKIDAAPDVPARQKKTLAGRQPFSGAAVANLNPALADELRMDYVEPTVIVLEVGNNSIAARVGVQAGDRIVELNGVAIESVETLMREIQKPATSWALALNRNGQILKTTVGE